MSSTPLRAGLQDTYERLTALVGANINLPPLADLTATLAEDGKRVGDIAFEGEFGDDCVVFTGPEAKLSARLTVTADKREKPSGSCIYVGNLGSASTVRICGKDNTVAIGHCDGGSFRAQIRARDGATVVIGDGTTVRGLKVTCRSGSVSIGRNCMFSGGVTVFCVDVHSIVTIEGETARQIRAPHACEIGEKVWVGTGVKFLSGARVGHGSIIGAHSVLAGEIPETSSAAGNPCRTIRNNITWSRSRHRIDGTTRKYLKIRSGAPNSSITPRHNR